LSKTKLIIEEAEEEIRAIIHDQGTIKNNLRDIEKKIRDINDDNTFRRGALYLQERADRIKTMLKEIEKLKKEEMALSSFERERMTVFGSSSVLSESARRRELDLRKNGEEFEKQLEPLRQELEELQAQKKQ